MTKQFEYETLGGLLLKGEVTIICRDQDGIDAEWADAHLEDEATKSYEMKDLPVEDQIRVGKKLEALAYQYAYEAYQDWAEGMSDYLYESWRDRQREDVG